MSDPAYPVRSVRSADNEASDEPSRQADRSGLAEPTSDVERVAGAGGQTGSGNGDDPTSLPNPDGRENPESEAIPDSAKPTELNGDQDGEQTGLAANSSTEAELVVADIDAFEEAVRGILREQRAAAVSRDSAEGIAGLADRQLRGELRPDDVPLVGPGDEPLSLAALMALKDDADSARRHNGRDVVDLSEAIGEAGARHWVKQEFGDRATQVWPPSDRGPSGSGEFDFVYRVGEADGAEQYLIVEAKGGARARDGSRGVDGVRYRQGTPEYRDAIIDTMLRRSDERTRQIGADLAAAVAEDCVDYARVEVRTKFRGVEATPEEIDRMAADGVDSSFLRSRANANRAVTFTLLPRFYS